jgi:alkanesulfonate monooxygenase SsuD/methylene tetrahydromethanopterin reductase-like flavin-dependent oxidoreductase (luciferase family)
MFHKASGEASVRYGIHFHNFGEYSDPRLLADMAREAEEAGWDGAFVCDHLTARSNGRAEPVANPWIALTAIALATRRVRIGPLVTPLSRRRPWQLASETVSLDQVSNGRMVLGVGSGTALQQSFSPFGEEMDARARADLLDEGLDVLTGLWLGERFSYQGSHYRVEDVVFLPPPMQQPRMPIWVAGTWPHRRPFRRAARWDGFFADVEGVDWVRGEIMTPDDLRAMVDYTRSQRSDAGPFDVVIGGHSPAGRSRGVAFLAPYVAAGLTWWIEGVHPAFGSVDDLRARVRRGPPSA